MTSTREVEMELHPGVFVSNVRTDDWTPDPEVGEGAEEHVLFDTGSMRAGLTRFTESRDPLKWTLPQTEVLVVLEGAARIEIAGGPTLEVKPGDMASLPRGAETTWHINGPFKEIWFMA